MRRVYSEKTWKSFHVILSQEWNCETKYDKIRIEEFGSIVGYLGGFSAGFDHMISEAHSLTGSLWFTGVERDQRGRSDELLHQVLEERVWVGATQRASSWEGRRKGRPC